MGKALGSFDHGSKDLDRDTFLRIEIGSTILFSKVGSIENFTKLDPILFILIPEF